MKTKADWTEKAKEDWTKYRDEFEANIPPDFQDLSPEETAELLEKRWLFMDYAEREFAEMPESALVEAARGLWWAMRRCFVGRREFRDSDAIEAVLRSRGCDIGDLYKRWHADMVAEVFAIANAMIAEGEPLSGMVRVAIAEATDRKTGEVDWVRLEDALSIAKYRPSPDTSRAHDD